MFENRNRSKSSYNTEPRLPDHMKDDPELLAALNVTHLIDQDTPIIDGVFFPREDRYGKATVVDYTESKAVFQRYLDIAAQKATNNRGKVNKFAMVEAVYKTVRQEMRPKHIGPFEARRPDTVWRSNWSDYIGLGKERLSDRMMGGSWEASDRALAIAALLETYSLEEGIHAQVSVDTGTRVGQKNPGDLEMHTWARFTDPSGEIYILDAGKGYCGRLEDSMKDGPWDYLRDGDVEYIQARREAREARRASRETERKARKLGLKTVEHSSYHDDDRAA